MKALALSFSFIIARVLPPLTAADGAPGAH
jgi:hypothetical protein